MVSTASHPHPPLALFQTRLSSSSSGAHRSQPASQPASIPFGSQHMTEQTPSSGTVIKFSLSSKIYYIHSSSNTNLYCTPTPPPTDGDDGMVCAAYALEHIEKLMRRQCPITDWGYGVRCTLVLVSDSCTFENFSDRSIRPPSIHPPAPPAELLSSSLSRRSFALPVLCG